MTDMPCYRPIQGYRKKPIDGNKGGFTTSRRDGYVDQPLTVSCGQCIGCKLERSRQWAIRCVHENQMHEQSCFATLTYDDDNLPYGATLHRPDFQKFMKRLIKKVGPTRLFYCGEYGDDTERPHYHVLLFGWEPNDPELFSEKDGQKLFQSKFLTKTWGLGHAVYGDVTFDSAAYCARYVTKKITGELAEDHYRFIDDETGEVIDRVPEFNGMSRNPGIGLDWLKKYGQDTYSKDEVILRNMAMRPPRAYDKQFEIIDPQTWATVRTKRALSLHNEEMRKRALVRAHPTKKPLYKNSDRHLLVADKIAKSKLQQKATL